MEADPGDVVNALLALIVGFCVCRLYMLCGRGLLSHPHLMHENYRKNAIPTSAGLYILFAFVTIAAGRVFLGVIGIGDEDLGGRVPVVLLEAAFGFGLLGFVDDVAGSGETRGFRGHIKALLHGNLTTGGVKLLGGAALSLVIASQLGATGAELIGDAVVIALAANLANLFDLAPGRMLKVAIIAYIPLAIVLGGNRTGVALAFVMGAALCLLPGDLRERFMLGDAGANAIGGVLGTAVVVGVGSQARTTVLVVLIIANLSSEIVSYSKIIHAVPPLRALDQLGRTKS